MHCPESCLSHHVKPFITLSQHVLGYWDFRHLSFKCCKPVSLNGLFANLEVALKMYKSWIFLNVVELDWHMSRLADSLLLKHLFFSVAARKNLTFYLNKLLMCSQMTSARFMSRVEDTMWGQDQLLTEQKMVCKNMVHDFLMKTLRTVGEFIHRSSVKTG